MKRTAVFLLFIIAAFGGCKYVGKFSGGTTTTGSGVMKTEQRSVPAFTSVDITIPQVLQLPAAAPWARRTG